MKKIFSFIIFLFLFASCASAQTIPVVIGPNSQLTWDMINTPAATAQTFTYQVTLDSATTPLPALTGVVCVANPATSTTANCSAPLSQIPTGQHNLTMTASFSGQTSLPSIPFTFFDLLLVIPSNIGIKK